MSAWLTNFPEADSTVSQLVIATTAVYSTIIAELLPTPAKSHYTFNLRDLSKVFQGMLMAPADRIRVRLHACILNCFIACVVQYVEHILIYNIEVSIREMVLFP